MRKTRPITLPDDTIAASQTSQISQTFCNNDLISNDDSQTQQYENAVTTNIDCLLQQSESTTNISDDTVYMSSSTMQSRSQFRNAQQTTSEPHSLQADEMLNLLTINTMNTNAPLLCVGLGGDDGGDVRPRQMGRRSEFRNRIVSITAERSSEGDQVKILYNIFLIRIL